MSDVYGRACKKIDGEKDPQVRLYFWSLVSQLCYHTVINSAEIMKFLEKSPNPRQIFLELRRLRTEHPEDNNKLVRYVRSVLKE